MASRFFQCICGRFATIDMFSWIAGVKMIECKCGRKLKVDASLFGFTLETAKFAWKRFMKQEQILK